jgi:hypothetical protein
MFRVVSSAVALLVVACPGASAVTTDVCSDFGLDNVCLRATGTVSVEPNPWARVKAAYR